MAKEIALIRIVNGSGLGNGSNSDKIVDGAGGGSGGVGKVMSGILKGLGIATLVGLVAKLVSTSQSLVSVVSAIVKLVGFLLKPIADVVMVLLMPLLYMLKPIVMAVNHIMAPFIKSAMKLMSMAGSELGVTGGSTTSGAMGAAVSVIFNGLSAALIAGTGVLLKVIVDVMMDLAFSSVRLIAGIFGAGNWVDEQISGIKDNVKIGVDAVFGSALYAITKNAEFVIGAIDSELAGTFKDESINAIRKTFSGSAGLLAAFEDGLSLTKEGGIGKEGVSQIDTTTSALSTAFTGGIASLQTAGTTAITSMINAWKAAFDSNNRSNSPALPNFRTDLTSGGKDPFGLGPSASYVNSNGKTAAPKSNIDNRYVSGPDLVVPSRGGLVN